MSQTHPSRVLPLNGVWHDATLRRPLHRGPTLSQRLAEALGLALLLIAVGFALGIGFVLAERFFGR